jgi:hypothetical protein
MMQRHYNVDRAYPGEWRCVGCFCINDESEPCCWQCGSDQDGNPPEEDSTQ